MYEITLRLSVFIKQTQGHTECLSDRNVNKITDSNLFVCKQVIDN